MTEQERIKYAYECMVKNNPDEAVKQLIRFDNNLRNLGMGGLHKKPDKFYDLSELPNEANILVSPTGYGKTYHEFKKLTNVIAKAQNGIKELIKYGDEWHWDDPSIRDYLIDIFNILGGEDNDTI
jgi:hypothetical protein